MLVGVLLAVFTSLSWACGNVLIQRSGRRLGSFRALLWAMVAGALLAGAASAALDVRSEAVTAATVGWTLAAGASGLLAYVGIFYAFEHARLSVAVPLVSSWSLMTAVVSLVFLGERVRGSQLGGAALVFVGVLAVSMGASRDGSGSGKAGPAGHRGNQRLALLAATGAAVGFGIMVPALGQMAASFGDFGSSAVGYAVCIAMGLPLAVAFRVDLRPPPLRDVPLVLLTGAAEILGFVAVTFARRYAPMAVVAPLASLASTFTVAFAWLVLHERPHRLAVIGAAIACVGVVVLAL